MNGVVGIVFNNQGNLLLVKRRDVPVWVFPGGGIEKGETPENAVAREVLEESGYKVKIIRRCAEYKYQGSEKINYVFKCKTISGNPRTSSESKEVAFFNRGKLPNPRHPVIDPWLKDLFKGSNMIIKKETAPINKTKILLQMFKYPIPVLRYFLLKLGLRIDT